MTSSFLDLKRRMEKIRSRSESISCTLCVICVYEGQTPDYTVYPTIEELIKHYIEEAHGYQMTSDELTRDRISVIVDDINRDGSTGPQVIGYYREDV